MQTPSILQTFWFCALALIFLVFFLLDGFDMGIGMALPFFSKEEDERKKLLDVVWPFWDGNELWAIIGGACLFAAFPYAFVALIGGLAPVVALLLAFLMFRTVSFEAWYKDPSRRRFWEYAQAAGSFLLAFGFGLLTGNLIAGLPMADDGAFAGTPLSAVQPYAIVTGLLAASAALMHGAAYLRKKTAGAVRDKAIALALAVFPAVAFLSAAALAWTAFLVPEAARSLPFLLGVAGAVASGISFRVSLGRPGELAPFRWSAASIASVWLAGGSALFPYLVRPADGGRGLSLAAASSPASTLSFLAVFASAALSVVALYTVFIYRAFKGKASSDDVAH